MVVICHGGIVEDRGVGGGAGVFDEERAGWQGVVGGAGDTLIDLFNDVGLVLRPGDVEAFFGQEAGDTAFTECSFVIDLRAGEEGAPLLLVVVFVESLSVIDAWCL